MKKKIMIFILAILTIVILIFTMVSIIKKHEKNEVKEYSNIFTISFGEDEEIKFDSSKRKKIIEVAYSVYFYDIEVVEFKYKENIFNLRDALVNKQLSIDKVIEQAEEDAKNGKNKKATYMDGGSIKYKYDKFSIIKYNSLDGNRDIYVGKPNMDINVLEQGY